MGELFPIFYEYNNSGDLVNVLKICHIARCGAVYEYTLDNGQVIRVPEEKHDPLIHDFIYDVFR